MFVGVAVFLLALILLSGCAGLRPTYLEAGLVHQSHAMAGPGPEPIGGSREDSTMDGVSGAAGWERGRWFGRAELIYALRDRNVVGGPWIGTFRIGTRREL